MKYAAAFVSVYPWANPPGSSSNSPKVVASPISSQAAGRSAALNTWITKNCTVKTLPWRPSMPKPIILAADDSVTVRKLIEISLKADEFDLHFAVNGKECLAKANALKPALLLLDYILPDMKGVDICHALLNRPETRDIPVLLISGNGAAIRQTYENAGNVADYLTKPFAPNVLSAVVGHLIAESGRKKTEAAVDQELAATAVVSPAAVPAAAPQCVIPENLRAKVIQSIVAALQAPLMA